MWVRSRRGVVDCSRTRDLRHRLEATSRPVGARGLSPEFVSIEITMLAGVSSAFSGRRARPASGAGRKRCGLRRVAVIRRGFCLESQRLSREFECDHRRVGDGLRAAEARYPTGSYFERPGPRRGFARISSARSSRLTAAGASILALVTIAISSARSTRSKRPALCPRRSARCTRSRIVTTYTPAICAACFVDTYTGVPLWAGWSTGVGPRPCARSSSRTTSRTASRTIARSASSNELLIAHRHTAELEPRRSSAKLL